MSIGGVEYSQLVDIGGTTSGWVGETDPRPKTNTPQFTEIRPVMGEIYANPAATQTAPVYLPLERFRFDFRTIKLEN
jgi:HK97 family phage major capsid protein